MTLDVAAKVPRGAKNFLRTSKIGIFMTLKYEINPSLVKYLVFWVKTNECVLMQKSLKAEIK